METTSFGIWIIGIIGILLIGGLFILLKYKKEKLTLAQYKKYSKLFKETQSLHPDHALVKMHKIFITALQELAGKSDTNEKAMESLLRYEKRFSDPKMVWKYHRMRNKVTHDLEVSINKQEIEKAEIVFKKALKDLL